MSGISEGEMVVTPGENAEVCEVYQRTDSFVLVKPGINKERYRDCDVVKLNAPLRVRVDSERQAEALVGLAEEYNFTQYGIVEEIMDYEIPVFEFWPEYKELCLTNNITNKIAGIDFSYDLTFTDDLKQIEAWIEYNGESEDECDTCGNKGWIKANQFEDGSQLDEGYVKVGCPNCTDDSKGYDNPQWVEDYNNHLDEQDTHDDSYSEPRPEDGGLSREEKLVRDDKLNEAFENTNFGDNPDYRNLMREALLKIAGGYSAGSTMYSCLKQLGLIRHGGVNGEGELTSKGRSYMFWSNSDRIDDLEQEISDCWENQQEYKVDVAELQLELHKLRVKEKAHRFKVEELQEELDEVREERDELHTELESNSNWFECYKNMDEAYHELEKDYDNLRDRIEEARGLCEKKEDELWLARRLTTILTPDSDEGDGE